MQSKSLFQTFTSDGCVEFGPLLDSGVRLTLYGKSGTVTVYRTIEGSEVPVLSLTAVDCETVQGAVYVPAGEKVKICATEITQGTCLTVSADNTDVEVVECTCDGSGASFEQLVNLTGGNDTDQTCVSVIYIDGEYYLPTVPPSLVDPSYTITPVTDLEDCCGEPFVPFEQIFDAPQQTLLDIPVGASTLKAYVYGAGGFRSTHYGSDESSGADGGYVSGSIPTTSLSGGALTVVVGSGGSAGLFTGYGNGGHGFINGNGQVYSGSGGGYTAVFDGAAQVNALFVAGGGGGAATNSDQYQNAMGGGLGGGYGADGSDYGFVPEAGYGNGQMPAGTFSGFSGGSGGLGGASTVGGIVPPGIGGDGSSFQGGSSGYKPLLVPIQGIGGGGGGGGGFIGGGGGGTRRDYYDGYGSGGGGGGSGYLNPLTTTINYQNGGGGLGAINTDPTPVAGDGKVRLVWS